MPLVTCPTCALPAYTAARWSTRDDCVRCGTPLPAPRRTAPSASPAVPVLEPRSATAARPA